MKTKLAERCIKEAKSLVVDWDKENLLGIYMTGKLKIKHKELISLGTLTNGIAHPREIFKPAITHSAVSLVLLHNHPANSVNPSKNDIELTKAVEKASAILKIPLIDHIIFNRKLKYYSFRENDKLAYIKFEKIGKLIF